MMVVKIKKQKKQKKVCHKKNKFENYKNCLEATELKNKIKYLEQNEIIIDSLKKDHKGFIRNNKIVLKIQQRFKSERYELFTEDINKSSNDDIRMQSIDSIETYTYGTNKILVSENKRLTVTI